MHQIHKACTLRLLGSICMAEGRMEAPLLQDSEPTDAVSPSAPAPPLPSVKTAWLTFQRSSWEFCCHKHSLGGGDRSHKDSHFLFGLFSSGNRENITVEEDLTHSVPQTRSLENYTLSKIGHKQETGLQIEHGRYHH